MSGEQRERLVVLGVTRSDPEYSGWRVAMRRKYKRKHNSFLSVFKADVTGL